MKENIYTIPVLDAFKENTECPFCTMKQKIEQDTINFVLGPSYMDVDVRGKTNELGFCPTHIKMLYEQKNSLGLALMLHSHMKKVQNDLTIILNNTKKDNCNSFKNIFTKNNTSSESPLSHYINQYNKNCYICNTTNLTFNRYVDTFFYLWKKDNQIIDLVKNSKGFCINHFYTIYDIASNKLKGTSYENFINIIVPLQLENLKRVENDLEWFTFKFDYRYKDAPWKNSKDALPRTITKISSLTVD